MRGLAIRVGIIAIIAIGVFVLRPFITGSAGDLNVGDCFDPPASLTETVNDVQHHPCTELHGAEVVYVGKLGDATSLPTLDQMEQFVTSNCIPAYQSYSGTDVLTSVDMTMGYFTPTSDGWSKGDRTLICYALREDHTQTKGSLKKAG